MRLGKRVVYRPEVPADQAPLDPEQVWALTAPALLGAPDAGAFEFSGDVTLALAHVDLIYARLSVLLCAADRVLPNEDADPVVRHSVRHRARLERARRRA